VTNELGVHCMMAEIIVNSQAAMHELWVALRYGGYQYKARGRQVSQCPR
jgi:frataxin-like iron-binding protein CyaY